MSYRTINIDGRRYEYVVGKTHAKIKTVGVFKNEDLGHSIELPEDRCECCGEPMSVLYPSTWKQAEGFAVTPSDIKRVVKETVHLSSN